jgi:hypothetical protein
MDVVERIAELLDTPVSDPTREELSIQINILQREVERLQGNFERARARSSELELRISNVRGHIMDMYSINGELDEDASEIARMLDIELTKRISGTATFEISFSADVPLGFDTRNFEISFDVDCDTYEAENFSWETEAHDVNADEED